MYNFPVEGSPLIPLDWVTLYFGVFLLLLSTVFLILRLTQRTQERKRHLVAVLWVAAGLKFIVIGGSGALAAFWLVPTPTLVSTSFENNSTAVPLTEKMVFRFDRPVSRKALVKSISPEVPGVWVFESSVYRTHLLRTVAFYPTENLLPDTEYAVTLSGVQNVLASSGPSTVTTRFRTETAPAVAAITPQMGSVDIPVDTSIQVTLSRPVPSTSEFDFLFSPFVEFEAVRNTQRTVFALTPKQPLTQGTQYELRVRRTNLTKNLETGEIMLRGETTEEYRGSFTTESAPEATSPVLLGETHVIDILPANKWTGVPPTSSIKVTFDQEVDHLAAESHFSLSPAREGAFSWEGNTLIFTPLLPLPAHTTFDVNITEGVKSITGLDMTTSFKSVFTTSLGVTKLAVPAHLQKYGLSCEIAALRMALVYRGVNISEDTLLEKIGVDPTPKSGNTWGNPHNAFVGNVRGKQMVTGYGVYWEPIARVARQYTQAQEFEQWTISQLTAELSKGNPIVIWVYSKNGRPTEWHTPQGQRIYAVADEHAVTAVGFVGPPDNPSQFIINDPLIGQVYWPRTLFEKKWEIFHNSGVVVY